MGGKRTAAEQREYRLRRQEAARKAGREVPSFSGSTNSGKETIRAASKKYVIPSWRRFDRFSFFWLAGIVMFLQKVQLLGPVEESGLVGNDMALKLKLAWRRSLKISVGEAFPLLNYSSLWLKLHMLDFLPGSLEYVPMAKAKTVLMFTFLFVYLLQTSQSASELLLHYGTFDGETFNGKRCMHALERTTLGNAYPRERLLYWNAYAKARGLKMTSQRKLACMHLQELGAAVKVRAFVKLLSSPTIRSGKDVADVCETLGLSAKHTLPRMIFLRHVQAFSWGRCKSGFRLWPMIRVGWGARSAMKAMCPSNLTSDVTKLKWLKRKMQVELNRCGKLRKHLPPLSLDVVQDQLCEHRRSQTKKGRKRFPYEPSRDDFRRVAQRMREKEWQQGKRCLREQGDL